MTWFSVILTLTIVSACGGESTPGPAPTDTSSPDTTGPADAADTTDTNIPDTLAPDSTEEVWEDTIKPPEDTTTPDVPTGPVPCEPALNLAPAEGFSLPLELLTLTASGGTGAYRFELTDKPSGALVNQFTGAYLSGDITNTVDQITVTDLGCEGSAVASITVVEPMTVQPTQVSLAPGTSIQFQVIGGSGGVAYELLDATGDATVDASGNYFAGTVAGMHTVRVTDTGTGQVVDVAISVDAGAKLASVPAFPFIPLWSEFNLEIQGGSGSYDAVPSNDNVTWDGTRLKGVFEGSSVIAITDTFTGMQTSVPVQVVGSQLAQLDRHGDAQSAGTVIAAGDIDGDGFEDAILGLSEGDTDAYNGGNVFIYKGTATGLDPTPVRVLSSDEREAYFGRSIAVADILNNDQIPDLIVGAPTLDAGAFNTGSVFIYAGVAGQFFSELPTEVRSGEYSYHQFGFTVATCDFNGDDREDLAVGVYAGEDRDASPVISDTGSVAIFLGYPDGLLDKPDMTVHGVLPNAAGVLEPKKSLLMGRSLAVGDMNGDGLCDLATGALAYKATADGGNDGLVLLYSGVAPSALNQGGISPYPVRLYGGNDIADIKSQFGRRIAMGDITGDNKAELIIGHWGHDNSAGKVNAGATHIVLGGELETTPATTVQGPDAMDWTVVGAKTNDYVGWNVAVADMNNDGINDVLSGDWNGDMAGLNDAGTVTVYYGIEYAVPSTTPDVVFGGEPGGVLNGGDRYGQAMALLKDAQGQAAYLFTLANLDDSLGNYVGRPMVTPVAEPTNPTELDMPGQGAGSRFGHGAAIVGDVTGDGLADLVVGAPYAEPPNKQQPNVGAAYLYRGTNTGFETTPSLTFSGHTGHGWGDELGWQVKPAGDFNGDGAPDIAVLARSEDEPATFGNQYTVQKTNGDGSTAVTCDGKRDNSGAVFIYLGVVPNPAMPNGSLPSTTPAFVFYGTQAASYDDHLSSGFDFNGDGYDDLVSGSYRGDYAYNNMGGVTIALGRPATTGTITVLCDDLTRLSGLAGNDYFGASVAAVGDLNGDGCDEFAVGAYGEDLGTSNQGSIRVFYGYGAGCAYDAMRASLFVSNTGGATSGFGLASGLSVDADAIPDIATGGYGYSYQGTQVGAAWIIPGSYVVSKTPVKLINNVIPSAPAYPFLDGTVAGNHHVHGVTAGGRFGDSVALVPNLSGDGRAGLAVGTRLGSINAPDNAGGALLYTYEAATGLQTTPIATLSGESLRTLGQLGAMVTAGVVGQTTVVAVGAYSGNGAGLSGIDQGGLYVLNINDLLE